MSGIWPHSRLDLPVYGMHAILHNDCIATTATSEVSSLMNHPIGHTLSTLLEQLERSFANLGHAH